MERVSDTIGNEYEKWGSNDIVFISAPTGSGKTYFILKIFLPYLAMQQKRILYLVNRRILKEQIEAELLSFPYENTRSITVELYQTIENRICNSTKNVIAGTYPNSSYAEVHNLAQYDCVVCDECHYFLADSNYNTNTEISFKWIGDQYANKIRIFLSATIDDIKRYIIEDNERRKHERTFLYGFCSNLYKREPLLVRGKIWDYPAEINYDYIDVGVINKRAEIIDLVTGTKAKWLIFVDNINFGIDLKKDLVKLMKECQNSKNDKSVVMISSDYESDEESLSEVKTIINESKLSAKILITTSVLDNGVNILDVGVRNIIVIADTKVEFIQMLGRKRNDGEKLKLYIYKHSVDHFKKRIWKINKIKSYAQDYLNHFETMIKCPIEKMTDNGLYSLNYYNDSEYRMILQRHIYIMRDIASKKVRYDEISKIFYSFNGVYYFNFLAFKNLEKQIIFYNSILDKFRAHGEDSFVKEQLRWLGKTELEIENIISESKSSLEEKSMHIVHENIQKVLNKPLEKSEACDFKVKIKEHLLNLVNTVDESNLEKQKVINSLRKSDRPISCKDMDFLKENCGLQYELEVKGSFYTFKFLIK